MSGNMACRRLTPQMVYQSLLDAERRQKYPEAAAHAKQLAGMIEMGADTEGICDWTIPTDWLEIAELVKALEHLNYVLNFRARVLRDVFLKGCVKDAEPHTPSVLEWCHENGVTLTETQASQLQHLFSDETPQEGK